MKILAINGSPRKEHNTAILLKSALDGAGSAGASTELIHLYDYDYKGCVSCFGCKLKDCKRPGACFHKDQISPILEATMAADAFVLGSPVYFHAVTGMMRSFMERLMFPVLTYKDNYAGLLDRKIPTGFIYTMNIPASAIEEYGYDKAFLPAKNGLTHLFGSCEVLFSNDTLQFDDYSKYVCTVFNEEHKKQVQKEQFPKDCKNAFEMGVKLVEQAKKS